ncbi:MAG: TlpA disulfide reductase family protein [Terriglobales bacterium]
MKKEILSGLVLISVVAGLYFAAHHRGVSTGIRGIDGSGHLIAPNFSLPDLTGQELDLSSYRGKVVLLDFWATWCDPCRDEIPHFVELQNQYGGQGLQIIGVAMDDGPEPVRDFYQRFKMNYPVVMGNAKTGELYGGVLGLPITFLIGRDGGIRAKHIGATDISIFEKEIVNLLGSGSGSSSLAGFGKTPESSYRALKGCGFSRAVTHLQKDLGHGSRPCPSRIQRHRGFSPAP